MSVIPQRRSAAGRGRDRLALVLFAAAFTSVLALTLTPRGFLLAGPAPVHHGAAAPERGAQEGAR